ncbi:MAG: MlaD family protein [Planctomycetota bacterium]
MSERKPLSRETQVGFLFALALVLLLISTVIVGNLNIFRRGVAYDAIFSSVAGLKPNHDVFYEGVRAGSVESITLEGDMIRARLRLTMTPGIRSDSRITIKDSTALGGKHVEITRGTPAGKILPPGSTLRGVDPENVLDSVTRVAGQAGKMLEENRDNIRETMSSVRGITEKINTAKGTVGKLISEKEIYDDLRATIADAKAIAASMKTIAQKIERGEGTIGKVVQDDTLYKKTNEAMTSLRDYADKVNRMQMFLGLGSTAYDEEKMTISRVYVRIEPDAKKYYLLGVSVFDLRETSPLPHNMDKSHIQVGADLQLAYKFSKNRLTLRGGLIEGKIGGGADVDLLKGKLKFTLEGRDTYNDTDLRENIDSMLLRTKVTTSFFKGHLQVSAGINNILEKSSFMVGLTFQFRDNDLKYVVGAIGSGM